MNLRTSVLLTLAYHDVFDYPLRLEEINQYLIKNKSNTQKQKKCLESLIIQKLVGKHEGYFYLKGRKNITQIRKKRVLPSKNKHKKAKYYSSLLKIIPTVKFVAITGALSMDNSTKSDDIDILIITAKNTLWTTRFFSNLILFPYKRKPTSKKQKDKACLNIFIDESDLTIKDQNLYTAHELVQLKPIFDRDNTYAKFVKANNWIYNYLPNWQPKIVNSESNIVNRSTKHPKIHSLVEPLEALAKWGQLKYMKSKITTEKIGDTQLFFHPKKTQEIILDKYTKRLKTLTK